MKSSGSAVRNTVRAAKQPKARAPAVGQCDLVEGLMPRRGNGSLDRSSLDQAVHSACDVLRRSNCAGALQYVPELTWLLFLRVLDEREEIEAEEADAVDSDFTPSLSAPYRWRDWASP